MKTIHDGLEDKEIIEADPTSLGLVKRTVCSVSGLLATDACKDDADHKPTTDWFVAAEAPTAYCDMHVTMNICIDSNAIATQFCPAEAVTTTSYVLIRPNSQFYTFEDEYLLKGIPTALRTELTTEQFVAEMPTCTVHASGSLSIFELRTNATDLIQRVNDYLDAMRDLDAGSIAALRDAVAALEVSLSGYQYSEIEPQYNRLKTDYERISTEHPRP